jgi:hypothetical protein
MYVPIAFAMRRLFQDFKIGAEIIWGALALLGGLDGY